MLLAVVFTERDSVLVATLSGNFSAEADEVADRQIAAACKAGGFTKVLMDFRNVEVTALGFESYNTGVSLGERGFDATIKIAILDRPEFKDANYMLGLVARNRGFQLQHFYTEEEAMQWLQDEE